MGEELPRRVVWPDRPSDQVDIVDDAAALLKTGKVVAIPTDMVYGLAAHPASDAAMDALYALKGRPREKAIALLVNEPAALDRLAVDVTQSARILAEKYWPGGLTLVLRSAADPSTTVALRMPNHTVPLRLISQ